jgi:anti-anti-sigma factor
MKISEEKLNDIVICNAEGEIDINTSPELRKAFDGFIRDNLKKVLIDFSNVSYIDSSGLATLIELLQRLNKIGGKLNICNVSEKIKNIFEVTKLHKLFKIFESRDEALQEF